MTSIRFGIVGAGRNTRERHIPGLREQAGVEVVSVCNRSRKSSERAAKELGIPAVYDTWEELVRADDTDAIVIGTWPYLHCPVTLAALEAGKHVMCEARMAMDARESRAMLEASRARPGLVAQVVPSPFSLPVDATVGRLLAEGYLGALLAVRVRAASGAFLEERAPIHWRQDRRRSGLNVLSLGIWYEAVMRWIGEATRVVAMGKTFVTQRADLETGSSRTVEIPDHVDVVAHMACGAQASFALSAVTGLVQANEAVLFGSEGTLRFADAKLTGGRRGDGALREVEIPASEAVGWRVEEEFVNAIRGKEEIARTTFEDGVRYMAFTEAAARSMEEHREVALAEV